MIENSEHNAIPHKAYPGYYKIPKITNYIINEYGIIISLFTGKVMKPTITDKGYVTIGLTTEFKKQRTYFVHVLVCLTFNGEPPSLEHQVNHKYGIKTNNYYKDLEWCTPLENMQYARLNGLIENSYVNIPIKIWNILNDDSMSNIMYFDSITDAFTTLNEGSIGGYSIAITSNNIYLGKYIVKKQIDMSDWPDPATVYSNSNYIKIHAKHVNNTVVYTACGYTELSKKINVDIGTIEHAAKRNLPCTVNGWMFSTDLNPDWCYIETAYRNKYPSVVLYNTISDISYIYSNGSELALLNKLPNTSIGQVLLNKRYKYRHFIIYYLNDKSDKLQNILQSYKFKE